MKKTRERSANARICVKEGKEIPWKEIVKGFEVSKNKIVILTDEDFEKANAEETHTIDVMGFAK